MKVHTVRAATLPELIRSLEEALAHGLQPSLGFLFCSVALDIPAVSRVLSQFAFPFFGSSSCGEIQLDGVPPLVTRQSAVAMLVEMPPGSFQVRLFDCPDLSDSELGREIGQWGRSAFQNPAFVTVISGLKRNGEGVVNSVRDQFEGELALFGGLSSDDSRFEETFVFTNGAYSSNGAVVCVFDHDLVAVSGIATSGWVGIGAPMQVTESEGNVLVAINGRPALDVYTEYLGLSAEEMPANSIEYPLQLLSPDTCPTLRAVLGVDRQRRAIIFAGSIPKGSQVRFSVSPGFETVKNSRKDFTGFQVPSPSLGLLFSCIARLNALGPVIEEELAAVHETWPVPGAGFFCYGEFGRNVEGRFGFFNETCCVVLIGLRRAQ